MNILPFDLTATVDADTFQGWLAKGLGRAVLYLQAHDDAPVRAALLHAIAHDLRFDRQCEDGRAPYLFDAIQATRHMEIYRRHVLDTLPAVSDRAQTQLLGLAMRFAQRGDEEARAALYDAFQQNIAAGVSDNAEELVTLDGIQGITYALDHLPHIATDEDAWETGYWVSLLEKRDGKEAAWAALETLALNRSDVRRILEKERADKARMEGYRNSESKPAPNYETTRRQLEANPRKKRYAMRRWGRTASDADLVLAAKDLLRETSEERLSALLAVFAERQFPLDHKPLLVLARHADKIIAGDALFALSNITAPDVRALALELAGDLQSSHRAVQLLVNNFEEGDYALVERLLEQPGGDTDQRHWLEMSVRRFIKAHPSVQAERPLLMMYESGPCSICRGGVVDLLLEMEKLPEWMRAECLFDANPYTREAVETSDVSQEEE